MRRLRYMLTYARTRRALADARKAWRGMTPDSRAAIVDGARAKRVMGITSAFNPRDGWVEELPFVAKPTLFPGMPAYANHPTGHAIAYLRWVLYAYSGYNVRPAANWGPWSYNATCQQGVYNTLVFFGSPGSYYCAENNDGWDLIDFLWAWNQ